MKPAAEYYTAEKCAELHRLGRLAFTSGHMGAAGRDFDREAETERGDDYETFPTQRASR
jgi:hypothetical protein